MHIVAELKLLISKDMQQPLYAGHFGFPQDDSIPQEEIFFPR